MKTDNHTASLKELFAQFVRQSGKQHLLDKQILFERWKDYVGDICAQHSKCTDLKNGILYVKVSNAALKFELFGHKSQIVERINNDLGPLVKDIIFR